MNPIIFNLSQQLIIKVDLKVLLNIKFTLF